MTIALDLAASLVRRFEGLRLSPYRDPAGYPTIGYGTLLSRDIKQDLSHWPSITLDQAESLLQRDLTQAAQSLARLSPMVELTDQRLAALLDFIYNLGAGNYQASTLRRLVNRGEHQAATQQFLRWSYAGPVRLPGLVRRRQAEAELYANDR